MPKPRRHHKTPKDTKSSCRRGEHSVIWWKVWTAACQFCGEVLDSRQEWMAHNFRARAIAKAMADRDLTQLAFTKDRIRSMRDK